MFISPQGIQEKLQGIIWQVFLLASQSQGLLPEKDNRDSTILIPWQDFGGCSRANGEKYWLLVYVKIT